MPRKKVTYKPDFLNISMHAEGQLVFMLRAQRPVSVTARSFRGDVTLHNNARKVPICITLLETARALLPEDSIEADFINNVVANLVIDEFPMSTFAVPDDWPF